MKTSLYLLFGLSLVSFSAARAADAPKVDFATQVKPLLTSRCVNCHHSGSMFGELSLENRTMAFKKRVNGPIILPGKPDSSMLYLVLKLPAKNLKAMPAAGHRVTDTEINLIHDWIKQGAEWPEGKAGVIKPMRTKTENS